MPLPPSAFLLDETLRRVARRYRLPPLPEALPQAHGTNPATALAIAIEHARQAKVRGETPGAALKHVFTQALAQLIREAMRAEGGDPAFQAMVLRHRAAPVREYASLTASENQDRRSIHAAVNAIAHPAKQWRMPPGPSREALARLHALASTGSWSTLCNTAWQLLAMPDIANEPLVERALTQLLDNPALARLRRLDELASDKLVRQYQSLWDSNGPRSGSRAAFAEGTASQQRGAAVEASATHALEALARRLNEADGVSAAYRVVTSMRVPASLPASHDRAKTEWDVVLLRRGNTDGATPLWDVCLLAEAKASVDAAATDLPRLLRGLRLLAHAEENVNYSFETQQATVRLRGASLRALCSETTDLTRTILYCCNAPAEVTPRLLSAASRMQLLSAPTSLDLASALTQNQDGHPQDLEPVWHQLLEAPRWRAVLNQYPTLCQARELMVNIEDLLHIATGG